MRVDTARGEPGVASHSLRQRKQAQKEDTDEVICILIG